MRPTGGDAHTSPLPALLLMEPTSAPTSPTGAGSGVPDRARLEPLPRPAVLPPRRRGPNVFLVAMVVVLAAGLLFFAVRMLLSIGDSDVAGYLRSEVVPLVDQSNALGAELRGFLLKPPADRPQLKGQLDRWAAQSQELADEAAGLRPPGRLETAAAVLLTTLKARAVAFAGYRDAIVGAIDSTKTSGLVDRILETDRDILAADRTYRIFMAEAGAALGDAGADTSALPDSAYFPDPSQATQPAVKPFIERIVGAPQVGSGRNVAVTDVELRPEPETDGDGDLVVEGGPFEVLVRVQNLGERPESKLAVKVELRDATRSQLRTTTHEVSLEPGGSQEVLITDAEPFADEENGLIVTVGPLPGETADGDNARSMEFEWRAP